MNRPNEQTPGKEAPKSKSSREEESRRVINQYANDLREFMEKLRRRQN
jgi:hypothetical protein